ncbi:MAG TPA: hypothetical protein VG649_09680 [Candidatus Angelobacter sp.]|nr:hypothetical protein [Candidatus Angelobacter sp.]
MDTRLKRLMKELGDAINGSLSESEQIAQAIAKIKEQGYDIFLVLEATIGFNRKTEESAPSTPELVRARSRNGEPELAMNANDVRFLKSLRISVDAA